MKIKKYTSSIRVYFFTIFFPAFIISPSANAELYQWWVFPYGEAGRGFPDPVSACEWVYSLISINWKKKMEPGKGSEKGKVLHCKYTGNGVYWEVISAVLREALVQRGRVLIMRQEAAIVAPVTKWMTLAVSFQIKMAPTRGSAAGGLRRKPGQHHQWQQISGRA
ncbi:hypothetical protein P4209_21855 [Pseudomonas aeruginosa]|nr:hypothetical protein [Pseudomonas aeruginosa]MDF5923705.1 hypothetical protein [Pseudomonas aeruginosa]